MSTILIIILAGIVWLLIGFITVWLSKTYIFYMSNMKYWWSILGIFLLVGYIMDRIDAYIERKYYDNWN